MSEVRAQEPPTPEPISPPVPEPTPTPVPEPTPPPTETPPVPQPAAEPLPSTLQPSLVSRAEVPAQPQAPVFEAYTFPEGVTADAGQVSELNRIIADAEMTPQARGQALVDLYVAEAQRLAQSQHEVFNQTREGWREQFYADPEIGGNRRDTTLGQAAQMRDRFAGNEQQRAEFIAALNHTGIGDHPAFIRFLANIAHELAAPRLVASQGAAPAPADRTTVRYPTMVPNPR